VTWDVQRSDEFDEWFQSLSDAQQVDLRASIQLLESEGPRLSRPYADTLKGSRHCNMKELRTQSGGKPLRTLFAFDPRRSAILLIGGDKTGDDRFYDKMIPIADALYDEHLVELKKEGLN